MTKQARRKINDWARLIFSISMIPGIFVAAAIFSHITYGTPLF